MVFGLCKITDKIDHKGAFMKFRRINPVLFLAALLASAVLLGLPGQARAQSGPGAEPYNGASICLPDAFLADPGSCLPLGPSQTLTSMAQRGLAYPPRPLPAFAPPRELTASPVNVAKINIDETEPAKIYATLEDAAAGNNPTRSIAPGTGLRFVSYIQEARVNGKPFVMLKSGEWIRASPAGYSFFQGLLFHKTPYNDFGWMIDRIRARSAPSWNAPEVGEEMAQYSVIQIYEVMQAEGMEWYMIGQDRWVPHQKSRRVQIMTTAPEGVTGGRWIEINLYNQTLTAYEDHQLVFATLIASGGEPYYTRPGLFPIYEKKPLETMSGAFEAGRVDFYYLEDVPWTMYFDQARALHGAYWRSWFGMPGTHGCVNLSIGDSAWLFEWANEGDLVHVWDPSGQTPTDPSFYGAGGA
jgi:hypothetical protein